MVYPIQRIIVQPFLNGIWLKEINGRENIPSDGKFVATPNHQSFLDDWIVPRVIALHLNKKLHMYVNRNYYKNFISRHYLNHCECIPVEVGQALDKKEVNDQAFKKALTYIENGQPMCIYPEGHRSHDGKIQKGKFGAARLAIAAKVPILPIGIVGTREVLPKGKMIPKFKKIVTVNIGKPLNLEKFYGKENDKESLAKATELIMKEISKLAGA